MNKIDDLIIANQNSRSGKVDSFVEQPTSEHQIKSESLQPSTDLSVHQEPEVQEIKSESSQDPYLPEAQETQKEEPAKKENAIDEYGNPVKAKRTYTEDEVQSMIRERLSRVKNPVQQQQQQYQQTQQPQQQQAEQSDENNWERELESFIDKRMDQRKASEEMRIWQEKEIQKQIDFEQKFSIGMERYSDFKEVVGGKPITDSMMLSIRNLDNPAAFVYGASKLHPAELEKIARIEDPYVQAAEMGKLHERMIKDRKITSSAPKPIEPIKPDLGLKNNTVAPTNYQTSDYQSYITQRVHEYAKQKRR